MKPISTDALSKEFTKILDDEKNIRIILSGIFGIGKTTFIKNFFSDNSNFVAIKLFPINYSVASNEDIFELIKYDIFYELLKLNPKFEKVNVSWYETLPFITYKDIKVLLGDFVALIPRIGKDLKAVLSGLEKSAAVFKKKQDELKQDDLAAILEFAKEVETTHGGIYENDFYSQLIYSLIQSLKGDDVKVVLVIDDLDRIDPEHIFRILNVFAAHFDRESSKNKFGIDKVVLCCDVENIRRIFKNRYGIDADFNGYIDKFFSKSIFTFNNKQNIANSIPLILQSVSSTEASFLFLENNHYVRKFLVRLLKSFINEDVLNLRMLMKFPSANYNPSIKYVTTASSNAAFTIRNFQLMIMFEFLIDLFGSLDNLVNAIEKCQLPELSNNDREDNLILGSLFYYVGWDGKVMDRYSGREGNKKGLAYRKQSYNIQIFDEESQNHIILYSATYSGNQPVLSAEIQKQLFIDALRMYDLITYK